MDIDKTRKEDGELRISELIIVDESLPEGYRLGIGDALKREPHDAGELAVNQPTGYIIDSNWAQISIAEENAGTESGKGRSMTVLLRS